MATTAGPPRPLALALALRYLRSARRDSFTRFLSATAAGGMAVGVAALILALSALAGFQRALRLEILSRTPQIEVELASGVAPEEMREKVASVAGVSGVDPGYFGDTIAVRWDAKGVPMALPPLPGDDHSYANGINAAGEVSARSSPGAVTTTASGRGVQRGHGRRDPRGRAPLARQEDEPLHRAWTQNPRHRPDVPTVRCRSCRSHTEGAASIQVAVGDGAWTTTTVVQCLPRTVFGPPHEDHLGADRVCLVGCGA